MEILAEMRGFFIMKKIKDYRENFLLIGTITTTVILFSFLVHGVSKIEEVFLAIVSGLFTSLLTLSIEEKVKQNKFSRKLRILNGGEQEWEGYSIKEGKLDEHISNARIEYLKDALLNISVIENKPPNRTWRGVIEMNEKMLSKGGVTYKYEKDHESGYKDLIIEEDCDSYFLYLFPVTNEIKIRDGNLIKPTYGVEVFKKNKVSSK